MEQEVRKALDMESVIARFAKAKARKGEDEVVRCKDEGDEEKVRKGEQEKGREKDRRHVTLSKLSNLGPSTQIYSGDSVREPAGKPRLNS
ncbi:hypothetical protein PHYPO_G00166030 [Pangasianodon hypophthalmus]|uniref:Uncharacterized protein n=1 Tax=Pangasianodon hypophthalmus TaxID=310915 RepID=A0A5N5JGZ5_PANHP|nr:hypothetical protein PHYPO_G00166030 [Pangasianodon hypophthalmus]